MNCGCFYNRFFRFLSLPIVLAAGDRVCPIGSALAPFSLSCERVESAQALNQTNLCAHSTAHDRFQEWVKAGVFLKLWQGGIEQFDELCGIDWDWLAMDGAMSKAPLEGDKTGPNPDFSW